MSQSARVISPAGRIDAATAPLLENQLSGAIDGGDRKIVVDLSSVEYISSAGLRALLAAMKRLRALGGKMVLCSLHPYVKEVFDMTGFSRIFTMCNTRDEALISLRS
ncbi:MAG: STAS domain protein [Methanoregulaceae archaeon PtaU1.Bin222]|jgi:anti-anti-sigma factor|nr:MAG: STAS domain protein [Methanoregulaceae archaeon PtaU1.Bin222]